MCTYQLPAHRKLLPRPCPQCGQENGGIQIVIFNPEFNLNGRGRRKERPYAILRISHYSKEKYRQSAKKLRHKYTKTWHNFQLDLPEISIDSEYTPIREIFNNHILRFKQSITIGVDEKFYDNVRNHGWGKIKTENAHWINKGKELKKCQQCQMCFKAELVKRLDYPDGYWSLKYSWLCESCYKIDLEKISKWNQAKKLLTHEVHEVRNTFLIPPIFCYQGDLTSMAD